MPAPPEVDVLIVGTGMGGATLGYSIARSGRSVIFLEQGRDLSAADSIRGIPVEASPEFSSAGRDDIPGVLARAGRSAEEVRDGLRGDAFIPYIGCGTGGSSSLYGMVLERFFPADFQSWPLSYGELSPWYTEAESLYQVRGTPDPLRKDAADVLRAPPPLSEANSRVFEHLAGRGLHPYRLHIASQRRADCRLCQGFLCHIKECKNDARTICLEPALMIPGVQLFTRVRVTRLESDGRRVASVRAMVGGEETLFRAKVVVLAAGALSTPALLLRSGNLANRSGLVGRRLMRHIIDLYVLSLAPRLRHPSESKELGLNDFYFEGKDRLGTVQSFGAVPPREYLRNRPGRNLWKLLGSAAIPIMKLFASAPIIAGITEDTPTASNRVELVDEGVQLTYSPSADDLRRRNRLRSRVRSSFSRFGPIRVFGTSSRDALGHVCGTATMGEHPDRSVVDRLNRAHDLDNLYIVDGSCFPTSAGMNPALTIAANALRVARHLSEIL